MKIHTCIRDAKRMELSELEAINRKAAQVQATPEVPTVEQKIESDVIEEEVKVQEVESPKKARKKKKETDI